jgi:hypothetical protein
LKPDQIGTGLSESIEGRRKTLVPGKLAVVQAGRPDVKGYHRDFGFGGGASAYEAQRRKGSRPRFMGRVYLNGT